VVLPGGPPGRTTGAQCPRFPGGTNREGFGGVTTVKWSDFLVLRRALESLTQSSFLVLRSGKVRVTWERRNSREGGEIEVDDLPAAPDFPEVRISNGKHAIAIWAGAGVPDLPDPSQFIWDGQGWIGAGWINGPARWATGRFPIAAFGGLLGLAQELGLMEPSNRLPVTLGVAVAVPAR